MGGNSGRKVKPPVSARTGPSTGRPTSTGQDAAGPQSQLEGQLINSQLTRIEQASRTLLEKLGYPTDLDTCATEAWLSTEEMTPSQRKQHSRAYRAMQALLYIDQTRRFLDERNAARAAYAAMQAGVFGGELLSDAQRGLKIRQSVRKGGLNKARLERFMLAARDQQWRDAAMALKERHPLWSRAEIARHVAEQCEANAETVRQRLRTLMK